MCWCPVGAGAKVQLSVTSCQQAQPHKSAESLQWSPEEKLSLLKAKDRVKGKNMLIILSFFAVKYFPLIIKTTNIFKEFG